MAAFSVQIASLDPLAQHPPPAGEGDGYLRQGAGLLINVSNDSWFDAGGGATQHFAMAVFRAVETRTPLLRVASTGVSGLIDSRGRIVERLPSRSPEVRLVTVMPGSGQSLYTRLGDGFAWLALMVAALSVAASLVPALGSWSR